MVAPEPTTPDGTPPTGYEVATEDIHASDEPIMTLRGAGVSVDGRRAGRVVVGVCLVAMTVLVVVLFVAGADKNAQITRLRLHGVPVEVTVTKCLGLLGGSGSNAAGYACRGSYTVDGRHYNEAIPGNSLLPPGATIRGVTDPGDPALISTVDAVAVQHASWRVFILPTILLIILVLLVGTLVLRRRHLRRAD
jgi:hypothetical protein